MQYRAILEYCLPCLPTKNELHSHGRKFSLTIVYVFRELKEESAAYFVRY